VLSLEFIDGISLSRLIGLFDQGREDLIHASLPGLDLRQAGHNLAYASLHQIFDAGFFHGDPHPGNIILRADNAVAFIDFGICGRLSPYNRDTLAGYIACLARGDASGGFRHFSMLTVPTEDTDFRAFAAQSKAVIPLWYRASRDPLSPFEDLHMSKYFFRMVDIARRNHVRVSADTLLFWRAMNALNYSALKLSSHFDLMGELQAFFRENRPSLAARMVEDFAAELPKMAALIGWPAHIGSIIDRLAASDPERAFAVEESRDEAFARPVRFLVPALVALSLIILAFYR
jgi:ubiquinone biosynthesis protein